MKLVKRLCKQLKESFKSGQVAINKAISLSQTTIPLLLGAVRAIGRFGSTGKKIDLLLFLRRRYLQNENLCFHIILKFRFLVDLKTLPC